MNNIIVGTIAFSMLGLLVLLLRLINVKILKGLIVIALYLFFAYEIGDYLLHLN